MGIFDDAIREHLDLKRRLGADEDELKQLEDEAFGLPARPGDPEFPDREAEAAAPETAVADAEAPPAPPTEETKAPEAAPEDLEPAVPDPEDQASPHGDPLVEDQPAPVAEERPVEDPGAMEFTTGEREAIADPPTELLDESPEPLELDELDLDLSDELDELDDLADEEVAQEPEAVEPELEESAEAEPAAVEEAAVEEPVEEEPVEEEEPAAEEPAPAEEGTKAEPGAEDVLEETPEFLRENPDDDELWFEQGEPKDFDF